RPTDMLCRVKTEQEVKEYAAAFIQLYREQAHYLERTAPWIERVGLAYVKERLLNDEVGRKALYNRFIESQAIAQQDPWKARAEGEQPHEFTPLKVITATR
ncbi:MAG: nitrite reductase large subunit, partial [Chromatiales bacterium]|nr:nitrite reductase large subunit [Chromatiales bacterium]